MITDTKQPSSRPRLWARLAGALLALVLMAPFTALSQSPAIVNIGTAGDFVALAKTGISATGTTMITGDIGISPAAATYITGFGLIMDPSGTFSTSSLVAGKVYAANYAAPTPTKMTTAIGDMETAYTDAAGRPTPNYTELYAGDITGKTLTPGLYKWGTGVLVSAAGVTLSGGPSDVWIFQIAQNLTIANSAIVTLTGGAQSSNIFWQVAGQVTLGTTSQMKGIILCQTAILMSTGASLDGRALAQTAVTMDGNSVTVVIPSDTTRPTVISTDPANNAIGVLKNKVIGVVFSEAMDSTTINTTTFTLKQGATPITGVVARNGANATFDPTSFLAYNTVYTGTITTGAKDLAGLSIANNYVWSFTTGAAPDSIRPTVISTDPPNNAVGVAKNKLITILFSEAMDSTTINTTTISFKQGTTLVPGTVSRSGATASFKPQSFLAYSAVYTGTITTGVKDLAGNALLNTYTWSFTTAPAPDTIRPIVLATDPANGSTDVPINTRVAAIFSELMDPATINTSTFLLVHGTTPVPGTVTLSGAKAVFTPSGILLPNTLFTGTITTGVKDLAGNSMLVAYTWRFVTGAAPDTIPPTVSSTDPVNAAVGVAINKKIAATFSETMDPTTITTSTFTLKVGSLPVAGTVTYAGLTATFTPSSPLVGSTVYTATITNGVKDLSGTAMLENYVWFFNTGNGPDTTHPTVTSTYPFNGAAGVGVNIKITATFSEVMDPTTISVLSFLLAQGATPVPGTVTYGGRIATFTPINFLAPNTLYTATITTLVEDLAGNTMLLPYTWRFRTGAAPDSIHPTVSSTDPWNGATFVQINKKIAATFSEAMDPHTISTATFLLKQGNTPIAGTVTYAGITATFAPLIPLANNTTYTATITTGVKDLAGNAMLAPYTWSFTTGSAPDITAPYIISTDPASAAIGVAINKKIAATFSERMDPFTINTTTFILMRGQTQVAGTVTYAGVTATFDPYDDLAANTTYTATVTNGVEDLAGNAMVTSYTWSFTTGIAPDVTAPFVISTDPANAATGVVLNKIITATFSEAMDPLTISTATFVLRSGTTPVGGVVTYAGTTATFVPFNNLEPNTVYTATITTGVEDLAGNPMVSNYVWTFTTGQALDNTAPFVISTDPPHAATGVPPGKIITATFSEPMNPASIDNTTFTLTQGTAPVPGTVTYAGTTASFTPASPLTPNTLYTGRITTGVRDLAGNHMLLDYVWSFFTGPVADTTHPKVCCTDPTNLATGVSINTTVSATFCEPMDPSTITLYTFMLKHGATPVAGTVSYLGVTATFTPTNPLDAATLYTATVTSGVKDLAGNAMEADYTWTFTTAGTTDVQTPLELGEGFVLSQNYPNPFNPSTTIQYSLAEASLVSLKVYSLLGSEVATLVNGRQEAGIYAVEFNSNEGARQLPSGIYTYRLQAGNFVASMKMILSK
ncbi:MAG: Ig-like domain-containing protein [Ignavibacteria bacterium]|nr:Ig-like domain-containing protein [Ignavibacteria bacterium]